MIMCRWPCTDQEGHWQHLDGGNAAHRDVLCFDANWILTHLLFSVAFAKGFYKAHMALELIHGARDFLLDTVSLSFTLLVPS